MSNHKDLQKLTLAGLLISLGIIYGDIGTSPLYVFKAIVGHQLITETLALGGVSLIVWTLTLQTTIKYVVITLQADNKGEGGIFSLFSLVRRRAKWLVVPAVIGGCALLADGIITPPISISSAIEGLKPIYPHIPTMSIVIIIIAGLFFIQQFGTSLVGKAFGPIMFIWFSMMGVLGMAYIIQDPTVFKALNPYYGIKLLVTDPHAFIILGAVFLCTTGAEALYSDLGHCGRKNIQMSWIFVKCTLLLNYLGQGAWVLSQPAHTNFSNVNPFYQIVPDPHLLMIPCVALATLATIIASQALISGSFTLISEAVSMNFWPRITIKYPSNIRGQIYIPSINWLLCFGCVAVTLYFQTSEHMTAAYGFSITIAMLMTTILMYYFMRYVKHWPVWLVTIILCVFLCVEFSFFITNAAKLLKRLFFVVFEIGLIFTMYIWFRARKINNRFLHFIDLKDQIPMLHALSADQTIPKYSSQLIYLTKANNSKQIEEKVIYSIMSRSPKRADTYWFVHIDTTDEPYTMEYSVDQVELGKIIRVDFRLGFRIQPRVNVLFRKVVEDMVARKELDITSSYSSLKQFKVVSDFRFVILEKFLSYNNLFSVSEGFILNSYFSIKKLALSEAKAFGLDTSETHIEKIPLVVKPVSNINLRRVDPVTLEQVV